MDIKVYYRHWKLKELRCYTVTDVGSHAEAIGQVQAGIQAAGDYNSKPFLAVLQGGIA